MGQGDALARAGENNFVFAHHRAAAQGGKTDAAVFARASIAFAATHPMALQRNAARLSRRPAQQQGGA